MAARPSSSPSPSSLTCGGGRSPPTTQPVQRWLVVVPVLTSGRTATPRAVLHGLWDFSLISNLVGDPGRPDPRASIAILTMLVLVVVVLVRRRHIEPAA